MTHRILWRAGAKNTGVVMLVEIVIGSPELNEPRCEAERAKGVAAKRRLLALLNAGKFSIVSDGRDVDRYGRELRIVTSSGRSIGAVLMRKASRDNGMGQGDLGAAEPIGATP